MDAEISQGGAKEKIAQVAEAARLRKEGEAARKQETVSRLQERFTELHTQRETLATELGDAEELAKAVLADADSGLTEEDKAEITSALTVQREQLSALDVQLESVRAELQTHDGLPKEDQEKKDAEAAVAEQQRLAKEASLAALREQSEQKERETKEKFENAKEKVKQAALDVIKIWNEDRGWCLHLNGEPYDKTGSSVEKSPLSSRLEEVQKRMAGVAAELRAFEGKWLRFGEGTLKKEKEELEAEQTKLREAIKKVDDRAKEVRARFEDARAELNKRTSEAVKLLERESYQDRVKAGFKELKDVVPFSVGHGGWTQGQETYVDDLVSLFAAYGHNVKQRI